MKIRVHEFGRPRVRITVFLKKSIQFFVILILVAQRFVNELSKYVWGRWMVILQWDRDPIVRAYAWCVWPGFRDFVCLAYKRSYYLFTPSFAQFDGWIPLKRCLSGNVSAPATAASHSNISFFFSQTRGFGLEIPARLHPLRGCHFIYMSAYMYSYTSLCMNSYHTSIWPFRLTKCER